MRVTFNDVKTSLGVTESYDIINAIRNSATDNFKTYVPLANAENVAEVGAGILVNQTVQNEFLTSLVDRIGLVIVKSISLRNPLAKFKKGALPMGRTIEEIFTDITKEKLYDAEEAEQKVFEREIPNVKTLFHERNRQSFYHQTIQDDSLKTAFISWGNFESFIASIINAIYNSAEVDEYEYMKLIIDNYYSKGLFKVVKVDDPMTSTGALTNFIKKARATALKMTLPQGTRDYNAMAVRTRSDIRDVHLFIDADLNAELDVDVLAKAFNMDRTTFLGNVTVIDGFASTGLKAVMVDKDWFMVYDTLQKMETIRNPRGLYWNYYYHVWQVLSASRFANAVAFVTGDDVPAVTQVIVSPAIASVKQGKSQAFTAYVRATDDKEHEVVWSVDGGSTGTSISSDGVLTVAANETNQLTVKATVDIGTADEPKPVVGEAVVNVRPDSSTGGAQA
ncbi:major head protein [Bacillus phage B103]|uniref:Major capsid protein n=1 Tax=Bacillus phage B103 TaxID=2994042 RepID=CAPSD_BPB03|nr:major head protein [Bacillus phage B103]Q37888.1 RecName: Full=Major capsid protein; AltName: Full=Gene product 8; Short=gp8; AltName: Full=Major head protein; AltName: Full=Protein p8 [Bacillus phage B103]CAA67655.1 major head protein [Bacillus phage B103]